LTAFRPLAGSPAIQRIIRMKFMLIERITPSLTEKNFAKEESNHTSPNGIRNMEAALAFFDGSLSEHSAGSTTFADSESVLTATTKSITHSSRSLNQSSASELYKQGFVRRS
jgi:hypothetical protein